MATEDVHTNIDIAPSIQAIKTSSIGKGFWFVTTYKHEPNPMQNTAMEILKYQVRHLYHGTLFRKNVSCVGHHFNGIVGQYENTFVYTPNALIQLQRLFIVGMLRFSIKFSVLGVCSMRLMKR
ncbi:unnamed protein product [Orchesella dallaii]|uniref:Uncharacterized protein n=1 Tax=Orchesella dallaii TaxID=48710 RepID=A0ABP1RLC8_9HEXA